jgi:hypothetical protein
VRRACARRLLERDDESWLKHSRARKDEDWNVRFAYGPVRLHALSNKPPSFPPGGAHALSIPKLPMPSLQPSAINGESSEKTSDSFSLDREPAWG